MTAAPSSGLTTEELVEPWPVDRLDQRFSRPRTLFFGIGAQKSATTWMDHYLRGHRDVCLPVRKEQHYWTSIRLPHGTDRLERVTPELRRIRAMGVLRRAVRTPKRRALDAAWELTDVMLRDRSTTHGAYANVLFQTYRGQRVAGEITPAYSLLAAPDFAEMAALGQDVRFFFVMRDPLERLWSGVKQTVRKLHGRHGVTEARVAAQMALALDDAQNPDVLRSRYDLTIKRLESVVPQERISYFFFETLFRQSEMDRLADFLGIVRRPARFHRVVYAGAGAGVRLSEVVQAQAREALDPVYRFARTRFGASVPAAWQSAYGTSDSVFPQGGRS